MNRKISSSSSAARTFGDCGAARVMASICELCAIVPKTGRKIHGIKNLSENILTKYSIINKMAFMKVYIIIGIMVLSIVLGICIYVYGQEKSIPENTLAVLQIEENSIYLMEIQKVPLEMHDESMRIIGNGDYYIEYTTISKDYPQNYTMQTFYVHIIPENNIFKFERRLQGLAFYENDNVVGSASPSFEWDFVGYSTDEDILEMKIFEYYINNRKKIMVYGTTAHNRTVSASVARASERYVQLPLRWVDKLLEINIIRKEDII